MCLFNAIVAPMLLPPTQPPPLVHIPPTLPTPNPNQTLGLDPPLETTISQTLPPPTHSNIAQPLNHSPSTQPSPLSLEVYNEALYPFFHLRTPYLLAKDKRGRSL